MSSSQTTTAYHLSLASITHSVSVFLIVSRRYMSEILPIQRKPLSNQSINLMISKTFHIA